MLRKEEQQRSKSHYTEVCGFFLRTQPGLISTKTKTAFGNSNQPPNPSLRVTGFHNLIQPKEQLLNIY